jgi:pyrimidine-nucleoside phosphorylase
MNQPLGFMIGNWLEVVESVECLKGKHVPDLMEVTYVLGGTMLWLGNKASSVGEGVERCKEAIMSGLAYRKFCELVQRQGGDSSFLDHPEKYPRSLHTAEVRSATSGFVAGFSTMHIGLLAIELGAGRLTVDDIIDPKAGIVITKKVGDAVDKNELLATISTDRKEILEVAARRLQSYIQIAGAKQSAPPLIVSYVDEDSVRSWPFH